MENIVKAIAIIPYRIIQAVLSRYGLKLMLHKSAPGIQVATDSDLPEKIKPATPAHRYGLHLNVGAGTYVIDGFKSLDHYSTHYYPSRETFLQERIEYDLRNDVLPFADNTVDNVYISHVIEHIETAHVKMFFAESHRVLKPGGVLRVVCPDARFLFEVSRFNNDYYRWHPAYGKASQFDMLVHQLATPRFAIPNYGLPGNPYDLDYEDFVSQLRSELNFDPLSPGNHINNWDYERLHRLGLEMKFSRVIQSKAGGSVSAAMQGEDMDLAHRHMSLYVDLVK